MIPQNIANNLRVTTKLTYSMVHGQKIILKPISLWQKIILQITTNEGLMTFHWVNLLTLAKLPVS